MSLHDIYLEFRKKHGVLDSIRFTARDLGWSALEVAKELGLVEFYLGARS